LQMKKFIETFDKEFIKLHLNSCLLIERTTRENLYRQEGESSDAFPVYSFGELILRSAGAVEQTFGGITCKLWDDPFEWALPEMLSTNEKITGYLGEVEETRKRGFNLFKSDDDLKKEIPNVSGELQTLHSLLIETLVRASHYQGRAFATFRMFSNLPLPRI